MRVFACGDSRSYELFVQQSRHSVILESTCIKERGFVSAWLFEVLNGG